MENKFSYTLIGIFVLIFLFSFMSISVWLTTSNKKVETSKYQMLTTESVSGVSINSVVDYQGVNVGHVTDIALDPNDPKNIILTLDINKGTPIKIDTTAYLINKGITGLVSVSLKGGASNAPLLLPTEENSIPTIRTGPSLSKRIDAAIDDITLALLNLSDRLDALLTSENINSISGILTNVEVITQKLSLVIDDVQNLVGDVSAITADAKPKIFSAVDSLQGVNPIIQSLQSTSRSLDTLVHSLSGLPTNANATLKKWMDVANTSNNGIKEIVPELNHLINDLSILIEQINNQPNSLIMGKGKQRKGPGE